MIPNTLVDEIRADFEDHVECARAEREFTLPGKYKEDERGDRRTEDSVAKGFGNTPGMAFDVAH